MTRGFVRSAVVVTALAVVTGLASTVYAEGAKEATGVIVSVDEKAGTVTIRKKDNTMTFTAAPNVKFGHAGEKVKGMGLGDLKAGDKITVHYKLEGDKAVAQKFSRVENTNKEMKQK